MGEVDTTCQAGFRTTKMIGNMPLAPSGNPHRDTTLIGPKILCFNVNFGNIGITQFAKKN